MYADYDVKRIFPWGVLAKAEGLEFQNSIKQQTIYNVDSNPLTPLLPLHPSALQRHWV